jgi:hemerythrin-like domain-containing protein
LSALIAQLTAEHELIDRTLGSLRCYVQRRIREALGPDDASGFLDFFRLYAGDFHHAREEAVFLSALVQQAGLPSDHGPIAIITAEHRELAAQLDELAPLLAAHSLSPEAQLALHELSVRYSHGLWHHIDAEDSVLFPEGVTRLRRSAVPELMARAPSPEQEAARVHALTLIDRYPPLHDPDVYRGEGCVHCPSYGVRCDGLEREWWTEHEWEDLDERSRHTD